MVICKIFVDCIISYIMFYFMEIVDFIIMWVFLNGMVISIFMKIVF